METENLSTAGMGKQDACLENSCCFESVKQSVADALHASAEKLEARAASLEEGSDLGRYGRQAAGWLEQSAEYVRHFDYNEADASIRAQIRQNPGRSLLIAGGAGLLIGLMLRRR